jgi:hypothetical protein
MSRPEALAIVYDLRDPDVWDRARYHRDCWGRIWTDVHTLGTDHVVLVFRSAGPRWHAWEAVRMGWILEERAAA